MTKAEAATALRDMNIDLTEIVALAARKVAEGRGISADAVLAEYHAAFFTKTPLGTVLRAACIQHKARHAG